jgi:hypothetical protein
MPAAEPVSAKVDDRVGMSRFTYFLYLPNDFDKEVMRLYLQEKYPNSLARKVGEMQVNRLTEQHAVIVLTRPRPTADKTPFKNQMGTVEYTLHPAEEKIREVRESKPIFCKEFWHEGNEDSMIDGALDTHLFLGAVSVAASPLTISWHPEQNPGVLKLSWV